GRACAPPGGRGATPAVTSSNSSARRTRRDFSTEAASGSRRGREVDHLLDVLAVDKHEVAVGPFPGPPPRATLKRLRILHHQALTVIHLDHKRAEGSPLLKASTAS